MGRFEKRISDEAVRRARDEIAAGRSLRAAAAAIGCAPSTLSVRIKKVEAGEARVALAADAPKGRRRSTTPRGPDEDGSASADDPVEVLRQALSAIRGDGEPDWRVRISALKLLAALRPNEFAPEEEDPNQMPIVVFDLPPETPPVVHFPAGTVNEVTARSWTPEPTPELPSLHEHMFTHEVPGERPYSGDEFYVGHWSPYHTKSVNPPRFHTTSDPQQAERWRAELAAGRLPQDVIDADNGQSRVE